MLLAPSRFLCHLWRSDFGIMIDWRITILIDGVICNVKVKFRFNDTYVDLVNPRLLLGLGP